MADQTNGQPNNSGLEQFFNLSGNNYRNDQIYMSVYRAMMDASRQMGGRGPAVNRNQFPISQSNASTRFRDAQNQQRMQFGPNSNRRASSNYRHTGSIVGDLEQGIRDELMASFKRSNFGRGLQGALNEFSRRFGFELKDLPHEYGRHLGNRLFNTISKSKLGQTLGRSLSNTAAHILDSYMGRGTGSSVLNAIRSHMGGAGAGAGAGNALANGARGALASGGGQAGAQVAGGALSQTASKEALMKALDKAGAKAGGLAIAIYILYRLVKPFLDSITEIAKAWGKAMNRDEDMRKKRLENGRKRLEADIRSMAQMPFDILQEAAKKWEDTWDQNLSKISLTQGYDKANTYALYSSIAERLNKEALGNVIPATDVVNNLSQILDSGLSGKVAEEFAYQATKLNAEIPTENFIGYAATYAQIAADQINAGKSQQEALDYATKQLQLFASNLLTASRDLAGGFTTGLKDASSLFQSATEIVQTAKRGDVASVSGMLTSISAMVGAVAPDLASGIVNNVVQAAIGGNSDSIVALRSLAGINSGNTAFLQKLAEDPQGLFVSIFNSLGNLQKMSPANYMETAEGLSSIFGVDMKALARVDFNNLATQISQMQVNDASLRENVKLLVTEQATTSAAQARYQEINQQILNDGLAYVIDSEYGRMVQQHMWEEQLANELENTTYAVDIQGSALSMFEGIRHTIANILNFLNPIGFIASKIEQLQATREEANLYDYNMAKLLEYGKVGGGNTQAWNNLLNYGQDLKLADRVKNNLGLVSSNRAGSKFGAGMFNFNGYTWSKAVDAVGGLNIIRAANVSSSADKAISSYAGFLNANVGKSALNLTSGSSKTLAEVVRASVANPDKNANEAMNKRTQAWLDSARSAVGKYNPQTGKVEGGMSVDQWYATASKYGIANVDEALSTYGKSKEEVRSYFESLQGQQGATAEAARKDDESQFRTDVRTYWNFKEGTYQSIIWNPFIATYIEPFFTPGSGRYDVTMNLVNTALTNIQAKQDTIIGQIGDAKDYTVIGALSKLISQMNDTFISSSSNFQKCLADWMRYIASKKVYETKVGNDNLKAWTDLEKAQGDKKNETILALANAMNAFSADELQKLDPQLQTNALLGKIVIILEAIMQQNNTVGGGLSLIDTLSALSVGKTK